MTTSAVQILKHAVRGIATEVLLLSEVPLTLDQLVSTVPTMLQAEYHDHVLLRDTSKAAVRHAVQSLLISDPMVEEGRHLVVTPGGFCAFPCTPSEFSTSKAALHVFQRWLRQPSLLKTQPKRQFRRLSATMLLSASQRMRAALTAGGMAAPESVEGYTSVIDSLKIWREAHERQFRLSYSFLSRTDAASLPQRLERNLSLTAPIAAGVVLVPMSLHQLHGVLEFSRIATYNRNTHFTEWFDVHMGNGTHDLLDHVDAMSDQQFRLQKLAHLYDASVTNEMSDSERHGWRTRHAVCFSPCRSELRMNRIPFVGGFMTFSLLDNLDEWTRESPSHVSLVALAHRLTAHLGSTELALEDRERLQRFAMYVFPCDRETFFSGVFMHIRWLSEEQRDAHRADGDSGWVDLDVVCVLSGWTLEVGASLAKRWMRQYLNRFVELVTISADGQLVRPRKGRKK